MKSIEQIKQDPQFLELDEGTQAKVLGIISEDHSARIEELKTIYNDAEKRRDFATMSAAQREIKTLKNK